MFYLPFQVCRLLVLVAILQGEDRQLARAGLHRRWGLHFKDKMELHFKDIGGKRYKRAGVHRRRLYLKDRRGLHFENKTELHLKI